MFKLEAEKQIIRDSNGDIEDEYYFVCIIYTDNNLSIQLTMENGENAIKQYVQNSNFFNYYSDSNGGVEVSMNEDKITLRVSKHGNGEGGSLQIDITNKQSINSFIDVLTEWKNLIY